jgi:hypothetical protein
MFRRVALPFAVASTSAGPLRGMSKAGGVGNTSKASKAEQSAPYLDPDRQKEKKQRELAAEETNRASLQSQADKAKTK